MPTHQILFRLLWLLTVPIIAWVATAGAMDGPPAASVSEWQVTLEKAERELSSDDVSDRRLTFLRERLIRLVEGIQASRDAALEQARILRKDMEALGPLPVEGAPAESPGVASRRKQLNTNLSEAEGIVKEADLLMIRAGRAAVSIKQLRRIRFTERVLSRTHSPLNPVLWARAVPEWGGVVTAVRQQIVEVTQESDGVWAGNLIRQLGMGLGLALLIIMPVQLWVARRRGRESCHAAPTEVQRWWVALSKVVLNVWSIAVVCLALYLGLGLDQGPVEEMRSLVLAVILAATGAAILGSVAHAVLTPGRSEWRLVAVSDAAARVMCHTVTGLAVVFALDHTVSALVRQRDVSVEVIALQNLIFSGGVAMLLAGLLRPLVWSGLEESGWRWLRDALKILIMAMVAAALLGYSALSRLLASHVAISLMLMGLIALLLRGVDVLLTQGASSDNRAPGYLRRQLGLTEEGADMLVFWTGTLLKGCLLVAGFLSLQLLWSTDRRDALLLPERMMRGFRLGGIVVSGIDILTGMLVFLLLLLATRLLQRSLDRHILSRARLDAGIRHSILSSLGYTGFVLAALAGMSTMGVNLSSLAVIAGALSLGIGFGMQNVVNNFVSGLILLVERPIKAGDLVVVGEHRGHVRNISIRATEIITFDRASVFIPNSSLIQGMVINRTHADKRARIQLPLSIDCGADVELARSLVLDVVKANQHIQENPVPAVMMTGIGGNAIDLELIAFVLDGDQARAVTSELCFDILAAFRRHEILLPHSGRTVRE